MKLKYRQATKADLPTLIEMLADDQLGVDREDPSTPINPAYLAAFDNIAADPNNKLVVVEIKGVIIGMLQFTYIPYLSHTGAWRCLIEAVRINKEFRGKGLGSQLLLWAIQQAKNKRCYMIQLTSNKKRTEALHFYENLGFKATHEGYKLIL